MRKIGIVCAGDRELEPFISHIENVTITEKSLLRFYEGQINGVPVVVLYSGVCKVNAAIATQILIDAYGIDVIINAGTAGGMDRNLEIFDTVISTQAAYHDVHDIVLTTFHPWLSSIYFDADPNLLNTAKEVFSEKSNIFFGRMVTGEQFIVDNMRERINEKYSPLSADMETASIAHVCYVNDIPFIAIRTITDTAIHVGEGNFDKNCDKASIICKDIVLDFLKQLKNSRLKGG